MEKGVVFEPIGKIRDRFGALPSSASLPGHPRNQSGSFIQRPFMLFHDLDSVLERDHIPL
jgi:hypothetical protein